MPVNLNPIEAHERTIGQVFSDGYAYEIPPYQRPYAWEQDQARDLLTDLLDAMNAGHERAYFLGSIVLIKLPNDPDSKVVDGQQRLTTLTILLSVLRDLTADAELAFSRRTYVYQKANPDSGAQDRYRLLLRQRDRAFFQKYIQEAKATESLPDPRFLEGSQQRIVENALYFRGVLTALDEAQRNRLVAFIIQHCYVVAVAVPTADSARRIFTVLNARGMDLTPTDMLKANLLERTQGEARELQLATRWEEIELEVGREKMVELFGHIRMIYERDKPRVALESGFPEHVTPFRGDPEKFVSDVLEPIADAFSLLADNALIGSRFGASAAKAVRSLERIDNKDWVPPALLRLWKPIEDVEMGKFFEELERVAFLLFLTRAYVNDRIERYSRVMDEIDPREGRAKRDSGLALSETDECDFLSRLNGPLYLHKRACKPVLERLDEALSSGGATYDQVVSIEHVLPQSVADRSAWSIAFPDESVRLRWTHRLANLVLLTKRIKSRASNWDFERKKREYFVSRGGRSPFVITQEVLDVAVWDEVCLESRQEKLLRRLCEVWRIDFGLLPKVEQIEQKVRAQASNGNDVNDGTWRGDVTLALHNLGGAAHLEEIYSEVRSIRQKCARSLPPSTDAIVRRVLEENSSDTESYKGQFDLFELNGRKGLGEWKLRAQSNS